MGRHDNVTRTPLAIAAAHGQVEVMKFLIENGANVNWLDRRFRTPLHIAASRGHVGACVLLLEKGAHIFDADMQGNSALHLAAMRNHTDVVDLLAYQSQEFTRTITSDRLPAKGSQTFDQIVHYIYKELPERKLRKADTRRFEK